LQSSLLVAALCVHSLAALAQDEALPQSLRGLPAAEFAAAAQPFLEDAETAPEASAAIRRQAAILLGGYDFQQVDAAQFQLLYELHRAAGGEVDPATQTRIREALSTRVDDWTDRPYDDLRGKIALMLRIKKMHFKAYEEAQRWVAAGGTMAKIEQSELGQEDLQHSLAPLAMKHFFGGAQAVFGNFSITWEGRVTPPASGGYTFSISPINVNASHDDYHVQQSMTVAVDGQTILAATPEQWASAGAPVQLTANQPVALRVTTRIESRNFPRGALHAMLFWQGPGVAKAIVPNQALLLPDEETHGLKATYRFQNSEQERSIAQTDALIDFAWPIGGLVVSGDQARNQQADALASALWQQMTAVTLLDALERSGELHPLLAAGESAAGNLYSSQRKMFLEILLSRPSLLEPLDSGKFLWLYRAFRMGATDEALEVFGVWSAQRADHDCAMPDFVPQAAIDNEMRKLCRRMAICVTQELPEQRLRLRDEHLELDDGTCCLPVAYTLGYSYQSLGQIQEWIAQLDARLNDSSVAGDQRVNWLIARAHADEIKLGSTEPFANPGERLLDGRGWLDEARLVAETPQVAAPGRHAAVRRRARDAGSSRWRRAGGSRRPNRPLENAS
jgi:hypothetical protein